jgi:hypothetical protein
MRFLWIASSKSEAVAFDGSIGLEYVRTGANMLLLLRSSLGAFSAFCSPHRSPGGPAAVAGKSSMADAILAAAPRGLFGGQRLVGGRTGDFERGTGEHGRSLAAAQRCRPASRGIWDEVAITRSALERVPYTAKKSLLLGWGQKLLVAPQRSAKVRGFDICCRVHLLNSIFRHHALLCGLLFL